jgi:hypothetical protein
MLAAACSAKPAGQATPAADPSTQASASHAVAPADPGAAGTGQTVQGQVLETVDAANYTYVRVKTPQGDIWAATLAFKVAVGDTVIVPLENPMRDFKSQALNRQFDLVYFATSITKPGDAPAGAAGLPAGHPAITPGAAAPPGMGAPTPEAKLIEPVAPAPGGTSIANIWKNRAALSGKQATVRGKVVKYNANVMGLNWIHLQDGSGSPADGTHDLTITTTMDTKIGDVVTIAGTVVTNKDFTAGYKYAVMLQGARIINK